MGVLILILCVSSREKGSRESIRAAFDCGEDGRLLVLSLKFFCIYKTD